TQVDGPSDGSSSAVDHVLPASVDTSTRWMPRSAAKATPLIDVAPVTVVASLGVSIRAIVCTGASGFQPCCSQHAGSAAATTSIWVSHLEFFMPYVPPPRTRRGKPCLVGNGWPFNA